MGSRGRMETRDALLALEGASGVDDAAGVDTAGQVVGNVHDVEGPSRRAGGRTGSCGPASARSVKLFGLGALALPAVVLGIRAVWKRRGDSKSGALGVARRVLVGVDEGVLRGVGGGGGPTIRVVLAEDMPEMPWVDGTERVVVGYAKRMLDIDEMRREVRGGHAGPALIRRSSTWCGLSNGLGALAVGLGVADCACCDDDGSEYSPWSSIVARGLFGYRCSRSMGELVLAARDCAVLVRIGESLYPDPMRRSHQDKEDPKRYLVAEDVFGLCDAAMTAVMPSVIEGVKRWAGIEQAQSLSLCQWLYHRVSGVRRFVRVAREEEEAIDGQEPAEPTAGDVLDALVRVRCVLREGLGTEDAKKDPKSAEDFIHAKLVAEEVSMACQSAMEEGLVFVVPTSPGVPPNIEGDERDIQEWEMAVTRLNCLAALAGIPQVSIPVAVGDSPSACLGISLLTRQRKDVVLLKSLGKLCEFIKDDVEERSRRQKENGDAMAEETRGAPRGAMDSSKSNAEAQKTLGNDFFNRKLYVQAIEHYSRSIAYDDSNPVYPSNRAMAYLKMGAYAEAEEDCSTALKLDPCNVKALLRRGAARAAQGSFEEAARDYRRVMDIEPNNRQAMEELTRLRKVIDHVA